MLAPASSKSSLTAAESTAYSPPALALTLSFEQIRFLPWGEGERYAQYWPGARLLTTQGLGHRRVLDAPEVIEAALAFVCGEQVGTRVVGSPNLALCMLSCVYRHPGEGRDRCFASVGLQAMTSFAV